MLDELRSGLPQADVLVVDDGSTDRTAEVAREHGCEVVSFETNRGLPAGIAAGYEYALEHGYGLLRPRRRGRAASRRGARAAARTRAERRVRRRSRLALRVGDGFEPYRYRPSGPRRFGTALLRRSMKVALRRPFLDATSGMYAANAKALPVLAQPYTSTAPEVQAILRLHEAGLRVDEVPVHMRDRADGESKLQGKKAVMVVVTIVGTLLALDRFRRK